MLNTQFNIIEDIYWTEVEHHLTGLLGSGMNISTPRNTNWPVYPV